MKITSDFRTFEEKETLQGNALLKSPKSRPDCFGGGWYWNKSSCRVGLLLNSAAHHDPDYLEALLDAEQNMLVPDPKIDVTVGSQAPWMMFSSSQKTRGNLDLVSSSEPEIQDFNSSAQEENDLILTLDPYNPTDDLASAFKSQRDFQRWPLMQLDALRNMTQYIQGDHGKTRLLGREKASNNR